MTGLTLYLRPELEVTGMDQKLFTAVNAPSTIFFGGLSERPVITKHIFP